MFYVATDDERIYQAVEAFGGKAVLYIAESPKRNPTAAPKLLKK